jgi:hypothetical protein
MSDTNFNLEKCAAEGPETALEKQFVADFLRGKGYQMEDLHKLPPEQVTALMTEACKYASLKLAEIEAKLVFRKEIRPPV